MAPTACLVVGGSGFLGQHIVKQLLDTQSYRVSVFDIRECGLPGESRSAGGRSWLGAAGAAAADTAGLLLLLATPALMRLPSDVR
jgi:nucleoside-diphosphate-sugar epimerase